MSNAMIELKCAHEEFDIPADIHYFNAAYLTPQMKRIKAAAVESCSVKDAPWEVPAVAFINGVQRTRELFAKLICSNPDDVAVMPSASYAAAIAAKNIEKASGNIVVLAEQFPSTVYCWDEWIEKGFELRTAAKTNAGWTESVLDQIDSSTAVVSVPAFHWTDGSRVDLDRVGEKARAVNALFVVDASQSVGAVDLDLQSFQPDMYFSVTYKWMLGPYGMCLGYFSPRMQTKKPLEEGWLNRLGSEDFSNLVNYQDKYHPGARRFDPGQPANFHMHPQMHVALETMLAWGVSNIEGKIASKVEYLGGELEKMGCVLAPQEQRAPHILGARNDWPKDTLSRLAGEGCYASLRGGSLRIAPHIYTTEENMNQLLRTLSQILK